ncbi:hypothetical protein BH18ACT3_BH18ACT3_15140 [soil metagenome]
MELRILGSVEVIRDGRPVPLGGPKQRLVLAHLLLSANRHVVTSRLIDEVWGDEPPDAARNSLQSYVSHLRKALGDDRIASGSGGYTLTVEQDEVDAVRFEALVERARRESLTDPDRAAATYREALALWRGPPFADLSDELSLAGEIARLDNLRLSATEHLLAAEIATGRHSVVVADLEMLTERHELRERLWAQLMIALYRSGRQAEALAAYDRVRALLVEQLGIEPSPELRELHLRILQQDQELRATAPTPAQATAELQAGTTFGAYRIERVLGRGGMGVVHLARHGGLGRKVALKLLGSWLAADPAFRERFVRESRLAASLDHPNVVPIYEAGDHEGRPFIAMRYVEGSDLRDVLDREGALAPERTIAIVRQIADALDAAHARGLVHCDVKPANVLLSTLDSAPGREHVYVADFGLSTQTRGSTPVGPGGFVGTLDYAAPEHFRDEPLDGRADQYSLGCVLAECLTGSPPFARGSEAATMHAHLEEPPPAVSAMRPDLPTALDAVVARSLAKSPAARYDSCADLANAATAALGSSQLGTPLRRRRTRRLVAAIAGAVALALMAVLVVVRLTGDDTEGADFPAYKSGMALIDAETGGSVAFVPSSVVSNPVEALYVDGSYWVLNLEPMSFVQIDATTGEVLRQIASPIDDVGGFTVNGKDLWITHFTRPILSKVDIEVAREALRFEDLPDEGGNGGVIVIDGSVWVARRDAANGLGVLARLDPDTAEVQQEFRALTGSYALVHDEVNGQLWTAGTFGAVNRIDLATSEVTSMNIEGRNFYIAVGSGYAWTTDEARGIVHQIDPSGTIVHTYATGAGARPVVFSDDRVWVGNQDAGTVTEIDPATGETRNFLFDHQLNAIAAGGGTVLVQLGPSTTFEGRLDDLDGDVAKFFVGAFLLEPADPALLTTQLGRQVIDATCARLVRPVGNEPLEWVPEVAADLPAVSADGTTYTFVVRPGFAFAPPSNESVTAETFRFSIERALSPRWEVEVPGLALLDDIVGFEEYRTGATDHISGIDVDGDTLSINLVAPSDDFLQRLASTHFCPVPLDTPVLPGQGGAVVGKDNDSGELRLPAAGPYSLSSMFLGEYAILTRNPNYSGDRGTGFDAIVVREGIAREQAASLVADGEWDGILQLPDGATVIDDVGETLECVQQLPIDSSIDLPALCPASPD